ncbi:MAG: Gp37 family protein [Bacteroidales bacterium]
MKIEQMESALCALITALDLVSKPYPQSPGNYLPDAEPGEVLVRYCGHKPLRRDLAGTIVQKDIMFEILAVYRKLRGAEGLYEALEKISAKLEGLTPENFGGYLELLSEDFLDEYNGTWQYAQRWHFVSDNENLQTDNYANDNLGQ